MSEIKKICRNCGKIFYTYPSIKTKSCSMTCRNLYWKKSGVLKKKETPRRVKGMCVVCGKKFTYNAYNQLGKYCSSKCYWKSLEGGHHAIETRKKMSDAHIGFNHSEETKERFSKSKMRERNPSWRGGISFEPYSISFNNSLRAEIRERDGYQCQLCGVNQGDLTRKLAIHHIDYDKKNCGRNNLITLCTSCNSKVNTNRLIWIDYFQRVQNKYGILQ